MSERYFGLQCTCAQTDVLACPAHGWRAIAAIKPVFKPSIPPVTMTCGMCATKYPGHEICPVCWSWFHGTVEKRVPMQDTREIMKMLMSSLGSLPKVDHGKS